MLIRTQWGMINTDGYCSFSIVVPEATPNECFVYGKPMYGYDSTTIYRGTKEECDKVIDIIYKAIFNGAPTLNLNTIFGGA